MAVRNVDAATLLQEVAVRGFRVTFVIGHLLEADAKEYLTRELLLRDSSTISDDERPVGCTRSAG